MTLALWTILIAMLTAITCALCGVFLVVKREALVSEGLSHAVLPGIVLAFVLLEDRGSPLLILGAALTGLLMVLGIRAIERTGLVDRDASLGIVFAALFSCGIILSGLELRNTHFHAHCIIDGNLALAPLDTLTVSGVSLGPKAFMTQLGVLLFVLLFLIVFYKELKLTAFDRTLARGFGFRPTVLHTSWLMLVSLTTVAAFEAAGSILVVALMITPPVTASLLTDRLGRMLVISCCVGVLATWIGYALGTWLDISPTGPMASVAGALFLLALLFAPRQGLLSQWRRRRQQRSDLHRHLVLKRLSSMETSRPTLQELNSVLVFERQQLADTLQQLQRSLLVAESDSGWSLTEAGTAELAACESRMSSRV